MLSDYSKTVLVSLLLLFAAQSAGAQFYKQSDSIARIIKNGVGGSSVLSGKEKSKAEGATGAKVKKTTSKKNKSAKTRRKKSVKKDTATVVKRKKSVPYTGRKYRLGERIIMRGDSGNDVKAVANILIKKLFLEEKNLIYAADGGVIYDGEIVRAVKLFQKVSGIFDDGIIGTPTLKALRKRD